MTINPTDSSASTTMRHAMVASQLRTNAVSDPRVVAAMATTPREAYVPTGSATMVYRDAAIPLGGGRVANPPIATGRLLTTAELDAGDRVLLIGAGGGYTAALLATMVARVVAVESDAALVAIARAALAGVDAVELIEGPLAEGHPAGAPYDAIVIDGAVETVPDALSMQVRVGGRVVAGLIDRGVTRLAAGRRSEGGFALAAFADTECAVLPGFGQPQGFRF